MSNSTNSDVQFEIHINHMPVVISCGIAFLGTYCAMTTFEQYRLCYFTSANPKLFPRRFELLLVAVLLGGVGIWAMHFVGMSSATLVYPNTFDSNGNSVSSPIYYRLDLTVASLIIVIFLNYVGLHISSQDVFFTKDRVDAVADFYVESQSLSISDIRKQGKYTFFRKTLCHNIMPVISGGAVSAAGICVMHFVGMYAMEFDGYLRWHIGIVCASCLVAVCAAVLSYWIMFRVLVVFPNMEILRVACAVLGAIAVNGMHYIGMAAANFMAHEFVVGQYMASTSHPAIKQQTAMVGAAIGGICLSCISLALALNDLRSWYYSVGRTMRELDMKICSEMPGFLEGKVGEAFVCSTCNQPLTSARNEDSFKHIYKELRTKTPSLRHSGADNNGLLVKMRLTSKNKAINFVVPEDRLSAMSSKKSNEVASLTHDSNNMRSGISFNNEEAVEGNNDSSSCERETGHKVNSNFVEMDDSQVEGMLMSLPTSLPNECSADGGISIKMLSQRDDYNDESNIFIP